MDKQIKFVYQSSRKSRRKRLLLIFAAEIFETGNCDDLYHNLIHGFDDMILYLNNIV